MTNKINIDFNDLEKLRVELSEYHSLKQAKEFNDAIMILSDKHNPGPEAEKIIEAIKNNYKEDENDFIPGSESYIKVETKNALYRKNREYLKSINYKYSFWGNISDRDRNLTAHKYSITVTKYDTYYDDYDHCHCDDDDTEEDKGYEVVEEYLFFIDERYGNKKVTDPEELLKPYSNYYKGKPGDKDLIDREISSHEDTWKELLYYKLAEKLGIEKKTLDKIACYRTLDYRDPNSWGSNVITFYNNSEEPYLTLRQEYDSKKYDSKKYKLEPLYAFIEEMKAYEGSKYYYVTIPENMSHRDVKDKVLTLENDRYSDHLSCVYILDILKLVEEGVIEWVK